MPYYYLQTPDNLQRILQRIEQEIYTPVATLQVEAWITPEPVTFAERQTGTHKVLAIGENWGKLWDCAWFHFTGTVPAVAAAKHVVLMIDLSGEAAVVDKEGTPVLGLTTVSSTFDMSLGRPGKHIMPFSKHAQDGENVDLWADAGCNDLFGAYADSGIVKEAHVALYNETLYNLYHDFAVLHELMTQLQPEKARYQRILHALNKAANELSTYNTEEAQRAREILAPELAKKNGTPSLHVSAIGHAHIDLAWLWPLRETIRKGGRSFSTVLAMMERYPDYIFGASQPQLYQWMKKYYPALYKKIQLRVAEGRWETQGAMWVEPDTNISGGEALVRQILYGMRFFRDEFGTTPRMLWLPDVFGYSAALPQILKEAGIDYFLTIKISWNTFNTFPHHTFFWQGLDGSRVLAHMPPEGTYNSSAAPRAIVAAEKNYADKVVSEYCALLYGIGDGGGGPGSEHLERLAREKNLDGLAPVKQEHMETFFERLAQDSSEYPTWNGELYLEKHQGTYTSQARNKRFNRKMELALRELEFILTLAHLQIGHPYPTETLDTIWQEVLLYQFHDILPGSSIQRVYTESLARYQHLLAQTQELLSQAQHALIQQTTEQTYTLFNTLSWERSTWLKIDRQWRYVTVPSMGYITLDLGLLATRTAEIQLTASRKRLENDVLRVEFAADGSMQGIWDKEYQREVLKPETSANRLAVYDDDGDAWDFSYSYRERPPHHFVLETVSEQIDGPQAIIEQQYRFGDSTLQQRIVLTRGSRRIDFITHVDWREQHKMLRTSFPLAVAATEATCDIQFGSIKRPTHRNTSWDMARNEICAHKWIDISQWEYGVALLNDCKYGHYVTESLLDLNLLRSPMYPGLNADQAEHDFTYALFPHAGNHIQGGVIRAGYELNVPVNIVTGTATASATAGNEQSLSFARIAAENVVLETIKKAEENDDIIIRIYEAFGATTTTTLSLAMTVQTIWQTNLLEVPEKELEHSEHSVEITLQPYEILTLRIHKR
ncbi:alpha-mannosidase [Ktedonobacteria bacterium brp13]|nr:alpha-mannosidase [Ktedonobacteria bacterium brp13]